MAEHRAFAEDGPLGGDVNLTVEELEGGGWPPKWVWTTGPGADERHLYRFKIVSVGSPEGGVPVYTFERTLGADETGPT